MDKALSYPGYYSPAARHRASGYRAFVRQSIELLAIGFYVCLIYKMAAPGIAILCLLILLGLHIRWRIGYVFTWLGMLSILYLASATITAFIVSTDQGIYRTTQFAIILPAFMSLSNYLEHLDEKRLRSFGNKFVIVTALIFGHLVVYHLYHGYLTTWKYLFDAKTTISIVAVILFLKEDELKQKFGAYGWWSALGVFGMLCLLSGERKAYILTAILFLLSKASLFQKMALGAAGAAGLLFFLIAGSSDSYIARQVDSLFSESPDLPISEFYDNQLVADQSDLIREFVNQNAWQLFLENPIMGIGANGYGDEALQQFSETDRHFGLATNVHGEINRVPVEGGLVGIVIALSYMSTLAIAVFADFWRKRMFHSASAERFPLYVFIFLFLYLYVEALDTLMLSLIVLFGFHMAKISHVSSGARNAARRPA